MRSTPHALYGVVAVIIAIVSVLQLIERDWLRGAIGIVLAVAFTLAATGFRERSAAGKRIYYGLLGVVIILLAVRLFARLA